MSDSAPPEAPREAGTVIVGGGVAGVRTAERLRRDGYAHPITIIAAETEAPYERPPLSKSVLASTDDPLLPVVRSFDELAALEVRVVHASATRVDLTKRTVHLDTDATVPYDRLVIATGAAARRLPIAVLEEHAHVLRTWSDAQRLRTAVRSARSAVVIGAGVLGLEIAATMRGLGIDVDVVDAAPRALGRIATPGLGDAIAALHADHGVRLHLGGGIAAAEHENGTTTITLPDGTRLDADVVVVAVGAAPAVEWLSDTGLADANGIPCDASCRTADARVYAVGDVARVTRVSGAEARHEHATNASDTAAVAARAIIADEAGEPAGVLDEPAYVWTDQYDVKLQILGRIDPESELITVHDDPEKKQRLQIAISGDDAIGVVAWNMPAALNRCRASLMNGVGHAELIETAPWIRKVVPA